jgi:hypothetical protein
MRLYTFSGVEGKVVDKAVSEKCFPRDRVLSPEVDDMTALGLHSRQMFIMTSNVVSREMNDANVYCQSALCLLIEMRLTSFLGVEILMALGMTKAVILFSIVLISLNGSTIWALVDLWICAKIAHVGDPAEDIGVETDVVLRDIQSSLYQNVLR